MAENARVAAKPRRRRYTAEYKRRILKDIALYAALEPYAAGPPQAVTA